MVVAQIAALLLVCGIASPAAQERKPLQLVPAALRWFVALSAPATQPPVITERRVFAVLTPGTVAAYGIEDGSELWRVDLTADHPITVERELVFVAGGEAIHALRAADGAVAWRQPSGTLTAPLLVYGGWVIGTSGDDVTARRAADGTIVWTQAVGPLKVMPTIDGNSLYLPLADNRVVALELTTGRKKWERKLRAAVSEVGALGKRVYVGAEDKWFYCLDAANGEVKWPQRVGAATIGRPVIDGARVYFTAMDNYVRALDRESGAIRWQFGLPFRPSGGPAIVGTVVVVPGPAEELRALDATNGKPVKVIPFGGPLASAPGFREIQGVPLAAAITGGLSAEWTLSVLEPATTIPTAPLTVMPGLLVPLPLVTAAGVMK